MKILRDIESPPGGWRVTVPQTGVVVTAAYAKGLRTKVLAHLDANGHEPPDDFEEWFEDAACRESANVSGVCGDPNPVLTPKQKLITPSKAKRFLKTLLILLQKRELVSREEAERRAEICRKCPSAGNIGYCWGCAAVYRKVRRLLGGTPIDFDREKRFCMECGCLLKGKIWLPNKLLDQAEEGDRPEYAEGCWRDQD